jgi:hypothetical protein
MKQHRVNEKQKRLVSRTPLVLERFLFNLRIVNYWKHMRGTVDHPYGIKEGNGFGKKLARF